MPGLGCEQACSGAEHGPTIECGATSSCALGASMSGRESEALRKALEFVAGGMSAYAAAKKAGIALSTIYRALKRRRVA